MVYQSVINRPLYEANPRLTLVGYDRVFADPDFLRALVNSNIVALLTLLAIPIGLYAAVVLQKLDVPFIRRVLELLMFSSMFVSPILWGFGWLYMYGPAGFAPRVWGDLYGLVPVGVISALIHVPYVYVLVSTGLLSIDSSYENAARAQGAGPLRTTFKITIPLIRPAIFFSAVVLYVLGIEQFGIPAVLLSPIQTNVLTTYIYQITTRSVNPDLSQVAVVASTMVYVSITLLLVQRYLSLRWVRRYAVVTGRIRGFSQIHVKWHWAFLLIAPIVAYLVVTILLPLVAIILRSLYGSSGQASLEVYESVLQQTYLKNAIVNTVLVALLSASIASAVYLAYGFIIVRGRSRAVTALVDIASTVPRAMPGLVAGLAFLWLFLFTPLRPIRYTLAGLAIAYVVLWSVLGTRIILTNLMQLSPELEEVGRALGASNSTVLARITIPLLKRAIVIAWLIAFIYGVRDYQVAVFLSTVDTQVIGSTIVHLVNSDDLGVVAALSTILLVITFAASLVVVRLGWKPYGTQV